MQTEGKEERAVATNTDSSDLPATMILEDLQKQYLRTENEEQLIRDRYQLELAPIITRKGLITTAINNLLAIYPDQKKNVQKFLETAASDSKRESGRVLRSTESVLSKGTEGKRGANGRRPQGLVKSTVIRALKELDAPVKAETVIDYIGKTFPELGLSNADIYTGLKDCRKREQIKVIKTYRYSVLTQLNCLPSFFTDAENPIELKLEYKEKLNQLMIDDDLKWEQE